MKQLFFMEEEYEAKRIVKSSDSIVGYYGKSELFAFRGISDFSLFTLAEGQEFDAPEPSETELLKEQVQMQQELIDTLMFEILPSLLEEEI